MVRGTWWFLYTAVLVVASAQEPFTLDDLVSGRFGQRGFNGTWISDTEFTFTISGQPGILIFNVDTKTSSVLVAEDDMAILNTTQPVLSADRQYILGPSEVRQVYRHSYTAVYSLLDVSDRSLRQIADGRRLQLCIFGGGHSLAYVLDNDLYYLPENSPEAIRLTDDGIPDVIYNGHADWVYEEDVMSTGVATWFSPEGTYLAFASYDDTEVETYSYYLYEEDNDDILYPRIVDLKYPKVGRTNPSVLLRIVNLSTLTPSGTPNLVTLEVPEEVTADHILGGVRWISESEVAAHWLNRRQNDTVLRIYNIVNNTYQDERRQQANGWVPIALPSFSRNGDFYVSPRWSLEQADRKVWQHLFVTVRVGNTTTSSSITPGAFTVNNFVGMDEDTLSYYYTRTVPNTPWQSQVRVAGARGACLSCSLVLPGGGPCRWAAATLSSRGSYMSVTCQSPDEPTAVFIINPRTGEQIYLWEDNAILRERMADKARPASIISTVPLAGGQPAPVRLYLPPGLDPDDVDTKYPMVYYVYSGPNTNTVFETFSFGYHSYMTTSRNVIYMLADGRGSGLNGQDVLFAINNAMGSVEIEDHSVILKEVLQRYQFIDAGRVGVWGHSYGGYAALLTLAHDHERLFKCGISGAPVTSWIYYNTMYTERYMGVPTEEDNLSGYEYGDVTKYVEKLRGRDFYIMHGNADDNVHYQNAAKLMAALQQADVPFEQMSYPDEAHSLVGVSKHRYSEMDRYWNKCFGI